MDSFSFTLYDRSESSNYKLGRNGQYLFSYQNSSNFVLVEILKREKAEDDYSHVS